MGRQKLRTMSTIAIDKDGDETHCCGFHLLPSPHVARLCTQSLEDENVPVKTWPAYSPDMSPIMHVWKALGRRVPVPTQYAATSHSR